MSFRYCLRLTVFTLWLFGTVFLIAGFQTPEFRDAAAAQDVLWRDYSWFETRAERLAFASAWHQDMNALRTWKWAYFNFASGLYALGASLLTTAYLFRFRTWGNLGDCATPRSRTSIVALVTLAWCGWLLAQTMLLFQDHERHYFPHWADTLIIPLSGIAILGALGYPILLLLTCSALWRARLPVALSISNGQHRWRSRIAATIASLVIVFAILSVAEAFAYGHWLFVPVMALWIYCALALRAAATS